MTVQTQTQSRFGRLSEWSSQTQARSTTFWDKLTLGEKEESINQGRSWPFNGQHAWEATGKVQEVWNTTLYPNIIKPLLKDNSKRIYKVQKQTPYSVTCWLVGTEPRSSHPAAIIVCANNRISTRAIRLIEKQGELYNWGFRAYGFESSIALSMGSTALAEELKDAYNVCGQLFRVGNNDGLLSPKTATIGGSVMLGDVPYGVTVLHPFLDYHDHELSDEDELDSGNESLESDFENDSNSETLFPLILDAAYTADNASGIELIGRLPRDEFYDSARTDCALIRLSGAKADVMAPINSISLKDTSSFPCMVSSGPPEVPLWAAVGTGTPVETTASETICGLYAKYFGLQDVWGLKMKPAPGNCGSWIVNPVGESIFGIIVAGVEELEVTYALPAPHVFDKIRDHFPDMRFPSLEDPKALLYAARYGKTEILKRALVNINPDKLNAETSPGLEAALICACEHGTITAVRILLDTGIDANCRDLEGRTPLLHATRSHADIASLLLDIRTMNVNPRDNTGHTPLAAAAYKGDEGIVRKLVELGAKINSADNCGDTPLTLAALKGNEEIVQILIDLGATIDNPDGARDSPLAAAAWEGHERIVRKLIDLGAIIDRPDRKGNTPLAQAAQKGHEEIVKILVKNGADVNHSNRRGYTALLWAAYCGQGRIVQLLVDCGAKTESTDYLGNTPLVMAAEEGHEGIVKILIKSEADVNHVNRQGVGPLSVAASKGHAHVIDFLLQSKGVDVDHKNPEDGSTALMSAVSWGHISVVIQLLQVGRVSTTIRNRAGMTAGDIALEKKDYKMFDLINGALWPSSHQAFEPYRKKGIGLEPEYKDESWKTKIEAIDDRPGTDSRSTTGLKQRYSIGDHHEDVSDEEQISSDNSSLEWL